MVLRKTSDSLPLLAQPLSAGHVEKSSKPTENEVEVAKTRVLQLPAVPLF